MLSRPIVAAFPVALAGIALAALLAAPGAHAQYKWVDADGRVNYGDRPPATDSRRVARTGTAPQSTDTASGEHRLPYALRVVAARHPVVIYTAPDCAPCELGREHLAGRGVPFTEKLVQNAADVRAFSALRLGTTQFPVLTVGADRMAGFEATLWNRMLDAAAYPRSSLLAPGHVARTLEPMAAPEDRPKAGADAAQPQSAQADTDTRSALIPERQQAFRNPIRF